MKQFSSNLHTVYDKKRKLLLLTITAFFLFSFLTTNGQNPTVTINQSATQTDPTNITPIHFTVVFDQPVINFATGDVAISGTAGGTTAVVTGGPTLFNVSVSGMMSCGTVIVNIPAGVCTNGLLQPNLASASTDNTVTFLFGNPNVTINQAASQPDPTSQSPINFRVVFDQVVSGFATGDVTLAGTAGATTAIVTGSGTTYNVAVSGITSSGTVIATIAAGVSQNACTQPNNASSSTDNTVTITCVPPVVNVTPVTSCGGVAALGPCNPLTASGNADTYIWSPTLGLYNNCTMTAPYTGDNRTVVQAGPVTNTIFAVTGTIIATGCSHTATAQVNYTPPAPVITPAFVNMCIGDPPVKLKVTPGIPARPAVWSPMAGLFNDPAATIPYAAGTPRDSVWARPTPTGVYTYQVTTSSVPGPPVAFTNPVFISIPAGGAANHYPSSITVSGLPATGVKIGSVILHGVNHTRSEDIDVVLQSPSGQNVILMSDVGGANTINGTYTFMDWNPYMNSFANNSPGTYSPTNNGTPDNFPAPGPGNISNFSLLNTFTGNYNGTWKLFVVDDDGTSGQGLISGGYTINFDTLPLCVSPARSVTVNVGVPVTITNQPANVNLCPANTVAVFSVSIAPGSGFVTYQWQVSTNGGATWNNAVGGAYSGSTTATLTVNPVVQSMNGYLYRVLLNGGSSCFGAISNAALLSINPIPTVTITANPLIIGPTQTTTIFSSVTPNPATTYTWYYNNSVLTGATSSSLLVNYGSPGDYQLRVTDANNCGVGVSNILTIANSFALNRFAYPNPSRGIFQVNYHSEVNNVLQRSLTVFNNWGEKIITRNFTQTIPYQKIDVDVRAHGKGIYWVEMRDADGKRLAITSVVVQ